MHPCQMIPRTSLTAQGQADFTDEITVKTIKIRDTGKGKKAVADDLAAVLRNSKAGIKLR